MYLNNEVSKIVGLRSRQVISWTEKGLVEPERPARKAGTMRGYSYTNLLEFGLAKYLIDVIGLQFYTTKTILRELREDGEIEMWASDYHQYRLSFARKVRHEKEDEPSGIVVMFRENDPRGLGGTVDFERDLLYKDEKQKKPKGTLYYIFTKEKATIETIRIISPYDLTATLKVFRDSEETEDILSGKGMVVVNLGKIKEEVESGVRALL